jgi:hypothetical protein
MSNNPTATSVATINNTKILVIENGEKRVAIKPICEALGVDPDFQNRKIKEDEILGQLHKVSYVVAADGKLREMSTIPFKWIFGWLFSINPKKVNPDVKDALIRYKVECYEALYNHFAELDEYVKDRAKMVEQKFEEMEKYRDDFKDARNRLEKAKSDFAEARSITFEKWKAAKAQLKMNFSESN